MCIIKIIHNIFTLNNNIHHHKYSYGQWQAHSEVTLNTQITNKHHWNWLNAKEKKIIQKKNE